MIRVLELFGGYGSQALALENLGIEFESDLCDNDKYAIQAYNQLHGETFNYGDVCSIDETKLPYYDLITYSSPCQDFSNAGKQAGGEKGSGTRSSLLWECERIIRAVKPKYLLMENVKALTSKKFMPLFKQWLKTLESIGYQNSWKVLNAKDYGVPQNRERVFVVSILGGGHYQFPEPIPLTKRLRDILEQNVDEKYYINKEFERYIFNKEKKEYNFRVELSKQDGIRETPIRSSGDKPCLIVPEATKQGYATAYEGDSINLEQPNSKTRRGRVGHQMANTLTTSCNQGVVEPKVMQEPMNLYPNSGNPQAGRVYNTNGISPAMDTCQGGNRMPKVTIEGYFKYPNSEKRHQSNTVISKDGICSTLDTMQGGNLQPKITQEYRIRKLTPRECWRLMGVRDEQFDKLHDISNSQLYKMAGNSIVVDVLMGIFKNMFMPEKIEKEQGDLFENYI